MLSNKSFLAVIPARGGSKRLPQKNRLPMGGRPLIQWTIDAALQSQYIDEIVVSSDDGELLGIAQTSGVVAQRRPDVLASDTASSADCASYVIDSLAAHYDYLVLLQPSSPFRVAEDIDNAIEQLVELQATAVISVTETEHSPLWVNTLPENHSLNGFMSSVVNGSRSQDLPTYYRLNGAIYIVETELFKHIKQFFQDQAYAYIMPQIRSVDIDTQLDLIYAESVYQYQLLSSN